MLNENKFGKLSIRDGGAAFALSAVLPYVVQFFAGLIIGIVLVMIGMEQGDEILSSEPMIFLFLTLTQLSFYFVVRILTKIRRVDMIQYFSVAKKVDLNTVLILLAIVIGTLFGLAPLASAFLYLLELLGYEISAGVLPVIDNLGTYALSVLFVCILPALCEELLFRGVMFKPLTAKGKVFAVLVSGALFALFHMNPEQTVYQFILGCVLSLIVLKTGTISMSILVHFLNNFLVCTLEYLTFLIDGFTLDFMMEWYVIAAGAVIFLIAIIALLKAPNKMECEKAEAPEQADGQLALYLYRSEKRQAALFYGIGIVFCVLMWVVNFLSGMGVIAL